MIQVMSQRRYQRWCDKQGLDLSSALFETETAYIDLSIRSRPGALVLFEDELVHFSYSWKDTLWAIFEPSVKISIPIAEIAEFKGETLSFWWNQAFFGVDRAFSIRTKAGDTHTVMLQRDGEQFETAMRALLDAE